ncbi:MAG: rod shape-determining protein MreC [Nocardioides sp.]|nr:rod shape-determining protein MreC [Nocardioides sp.]
MVALLLAGAPLVALDASAGDGSPVDPARRVLGEVFGPIESGTSAALSPVLGAREWLTSTGDLRRDRDALQLANAQLEEQARTADFDRNRLREYDRLTSAANSYGRALVPARVIGVGAAQSFSRTVTIDAGTRSGLHADMTVVNGDGLVGRIVRVTSGTATVLLVVDAESAVGGRVAQSMKVGFLTGQGSLDAGGRLDLELVDQAHVPSRDDSVVTWGSDDGAPYVAGIPVGRVTSVYTSLRETTQRAEIAPYVDFGALDLVGVVVPSGTRSDRAVIEADGSLR